MQSVELEQLSLYLDSDITPWYVSKPWELLLPSEWAQVWYSTLCRMSYIFKILALIFNTYTQVFKFGTNDGKPDHILKEHTYILQPVSGNAKYSKQRQNASISSSQALQKAAVNLDDVTLCLSKVNINN